MPKSKFWNEVKNKHQDNKPFFSLAPMEAVTDTVFRRVVDKATAPDLFYTEFVNSTSIIHEKAKFSAAHRLYVAKNEKMPIAQIWGKDPEHFYKSALELKQRGFEAIDLNMGCPDPTVIKNGGGSALIKDYENAAAIIQATKESGLPVSVKTRLGFNTIDDYVDWVPHLLKQGIEVLTIHLRSRKEMSRVDAHYELIDEIIKMRDEIAPDTLIQINGDIKTKSEGMELFKKHPGIDGIMIGRGIFEDPFVFDSEHTHPQEDMFELFKLQLDLFDDYVENIGKKRFETLRRFFKIYVRNLPNAAHYRDQLMQTHTTDEARAIIAEVEREMKESKLEEVVNG